MYAPIEMFEIKVKNVLSSLCKTPLETLTVLDNFNVTKSVH